MSDQEKLKAQQEARSSSRELNSADRARLWAGMNRYLAAELAHAKKRETEDEDPAPDDKTAPRSS